MMRLIFLLALLALAAGPASVAHADRGIEARLDRIVDATTAIRGFPARVVEVATSDDLTLQGLNWPQRDGRPLIVFFPGWQTRPENVVTHVEPAVRAGYGVLAAIPRGTAGNPGKAGETGFYDDGQNYARLALTLAGATPVVLFGYSIGAPVAIEVARREPVAGVVTLGLFTSMDEVRFPLAANFVPDPFDSRASIAEVTVPMVLFYGGDDGIVPLAQGRELFRRATGPRALVAVEGGGHFMRARNVLPLFAAAVDAILANDLGQLRQLSTGNIQVTIAGAAAAASVEEPANPASPDPEPEAPEAAPASTDTSAPALRAPAAKWR
ncbi:MAG TPA: alpha/beta hydrolase [Hyphomicrobiales bacterium]|nr:alpha/beta hydrolase [Hyphomicrobiales bacterium]